MNLKKFKIFMSYLQKNSINNIPISAIFTSNRNISSLKENFDVNYKNYLEDPFYNPLGISIFCPNYSNQ
jgi:hypothetical protein